MQDVTTRAIEAVGSQSPGDWELRPKTHASSLKDAAGAAPLARVLARPELEQIIDAFDAADKAATAAQTRYKGVARLAALTSFLSIVLAATMLLPRTGGLSETVTTSAVAVQFACLVASILSSLWLGWRKPFQVWMHNRAEAESQRVRLFRSVMEADEPVHAGELPLLPLQLEYFRRFQFDVQRSYYLGRGRQHLAAVKRRLVLRGFALLLIVAAGLPVLWTLQGKDWFPAALAPMLANMPPKTELAQRLFLCFGLIGGALQGLLAAYALMSYDERNGVRYHDTWLNLEALATRPLDEARSAAAAGQREGPLAFVALSHEQISSEHREWVSLRSVSPDLSLEKLRKLALPKLS